MNSFNALGGNDPLTLKITGTIGEFSLESDSLSRVMYIETYISPTSDENDALTDKMKPVRELFDIEKLDFSNLIQRDLNDARVSNELIPYLLKKDGVPFKFFPPILAIAIPVSQKVPTNCFAERTTYKNDGLSGYEFKNQMRITTSDEMPMLGKLEVKPEKIHFAIIDGQHRAMVILALYRNLVGGWGGGCQTI